MTKRAAPRPRLLHPAAWWVWALCMGVAASRTTNPWLCLLLVGVLIWTVAERREPGTGHILRTFVVMGVAVIVLRLAVMVVTGGGRIGRHVALDLPMIPLPEWLGGLRLGGPVSVEALLQALYEGGQLAAVLACFGAANALASPRRLLRYVPATLYDVGTALVVGLTYAPRLIDEARRLSRARRLRGRSGRGVRESGRLILPVIASALDGALELAASMEIRGYGRAATSAAAQRRSSAVAVLGLVGVVVGTYGLLDGGTPAIVGLPTLVLGLVLAAGTLVVGAGRDPRSRYRRDPFGRPEWVTVCCGLIVAGAAVAAAAIDPLGMTPLTVPLAPPDLPLLPVIGLVLAGLPAVFTPATPDPSVDAVRVHPTDTGADSRSAFRGGDGAFAGDDMGVQGDDITPHVLAPALIRGTARAGAGALQQRASVLLRPADAVLAATPSRSAPSGTPPSQPDAGQR